jgi:hypothetical protein
MAVSDRRTLSTPSLGSVTVSSPTAHAAAIKRRRDATRRSDDVSKMGRPFEC